MKYEDLKIYQLAKKLRDELYQDLIKIPHYWKNKEVDQAIRSSSSSVSNIVEGFGRRFYPKDFYRFLDISLASSDETQNHVLSLHEKGHLNDEKSAYYVKSFKTLSIKTLNFMNYLRRRFRIPQSLKPR